MDEVVPLWYSNVKKEIDECNQQPIVIDFPCAKEMIIGVCSRAPGLNSVGKTKRVSG